MNSDDLYYLLLSILQYVLGSDVTLKDGETIGFSEDQKIKITESKAVYLEGNSLKLDVQTMIYNSMSFLDWGFYEA